MPKVPCRDGETVSVTQPVLNRDRYPQEGCGNGGGTLARACVLAVEEGVQLTVQLGIATVGSGGVEGVHSRSVIRSERGNELRRWACEVERVGGLLERNVLFGHSGGRESLDCVVLDAPCHRTDEPFWGRRRVGRADLQDLGDERWVVRDPVPYDDPAP